MRREEVACKKAGKFGWVKAISESPQRGCLQGLKRRLKSKSTKALTRKGK